MTSAIDRTLERLKRIDFFSSVESAEHIPLRRCESVVVPTWREAVLLRGSDQAANAFSEGSGYLTRTLSAKFREQYREWNTIARSNRERLEASLLPGIDEKIQAISDLQSIDYGQQLVKDFVRWDLMHYAAEDAYSELVEPRFYSCLIEVYEAGRFPCHWDEAWPDGQIWIL